MAPDHLWLTNVIHGIGPEIKQALAAADEAFHAWEALEPGNVRFEIRLLWYLSHSTDYKQMLLRAAGLQEERAALFGGAVIRLTVDEMRRFTQALVLKIERLGPDVQKARAEAEEAGRMRAATDPGDVRFAARQERYMDHSTYYQYLLDEERKLFDKWAALSAGLNKLAASQHRVLPRKPPPRRRRMKPAVHASATLGTIPEVDEQFEPQ